MHLVIHSRFPAQQVSVVTSAAPLNVAGSNDYWYEQRVSNIVMDATMLGLGLAGVAFFSGPVTLFAGSVYALSVFGLVNGSLKLGLDLSLSQSDLQSVDAAWAYTGLAGRFGGAISSVFGTSPTDSAAWASRSEFAVGVATGFSSFKQDQKFADLLSTGLLTTSWFSDEINRYGSSVSSADSSGFFFALPELTPHLMDWHDPSTMQTFPNLYDSSLFSEVGSPFGNTFDSGWTGDSFGSWDGGTWDSSFGSGNLFGNSNSGGTSPIYGPSRD